MEVEPTWARAGAEHRNGLAPGSPEAAGHAPVSEGSEAKRSDEEDLRQALWRALREGNQQRQREQELYDAFEAQAEQEEVELVAEIQQERAKLKALKGQRRRAAKGLHEQQAQQAQQIMAEIHQAEAERNNLLDLGEELQAELAAARGRNVLMAPHGREAIAVVDAGDADAMESMLRAEAQLLRNTLRLCTQQREDAQEKRAADRERELRQELLQSQQSEARELEEAERRLQAAWQRLPARQQHPRGAPDASLLELRELEAEVAEAEEEYEATKAELTPLHEESDHLLRLRRAAEVRIAELERRLQANLRAATELALRTLRQTGLTRTAALIFVLARLCGTPRLAFLALNCNRSGRISMHEFDSSLRLRFCLDYEVITGLKLRDLFKEIDRDGKWVLTMKDFAACCPEVWEQHGRRDQGAPYTFPTTSNRRAALEELGALSGDDSPRQRQAIAPAAAQRRGRSAGAASRRPPATAEAGPVRRLELCR